MTSGTPQQPPNVVTATAALTPKTLPAPGSWGAPMTRQRELLDLLNAYAYKQAANHPDAKLGPFAGKRLTGADVYWLAAYMLVADGAGRALGDPALTANGAVFLVQMQDSETRLTSATGNPLLRASLNFAHLDLRNAILSGANLEHAVLGGAQLNGALLGAANLRGAYLGSAKMADAFMDRADLNGAILREARLERVSLRRADMRFVDLGAAVLDDAIMRNADLREAQLISAQVCRVDLREGLLQKANFIQATLIDAYLYEARLEGTYFTDANLEGCDLRRTTLDGETRLNNARLNDASLEQARLEDANLAVVEWRRIRVSVEDTEKTPQAGQSVKKPDKQWRGVKRLGDEIEASEKRKRIYTYDDNGRHREIKRGARKTWRERANNYRAAARAYRALSVAMSSQGLSREATRFQYRAEVMGRKVTFHDYNWLRWVASLALDVFAGYGIYQIWRLLLTYLGLIFIFTGAYLFIGHVTGPAIDFPTALVLSFTSFHGRGLQPSSNLSAAMQYAAVAEAVFGVLVEALLVAALVRRITGD